MVSSQRIDPETVRRILDTANIVEVVGDYVNLRRSGANYTGLCPFHNERTPSFSVSPSRGICKCFSCGKGGSTVGFVMEMEKLSYGEALRWLAKRYNIEIKERELTAEEIAAASERESMLALNDFALSFFEHTLTQTPEGQQVGLAYFRERGLSDASIAKFRLGFAPEQRDALASAALAKGYSKELLVKLGLCSQSDRGTLFDRFRGRVIYPVFALSGKVLAFGGRTLKTTKEVAKYVNSPESTIYHKSNELYGLYQARRAIVNQDKCILVEGYMDVISMSQRGVENVVASSGTSLTEGQIALIHRFTSNVTLIYDADPAGIKASLRGIDMLLARGMNIKVLLLPEGEDPDSFAKSHTLEEIQAYFAANETDFIRFKAKVMLESLQDPNDPVARAGVITSMAKSISVITNDVLRSEYVKTCAELLHTREDVVALHVSRLRNDALDREAQKAPAEQMEPVVDPTLVTVRKSSARSDRASSLRPSEMEVVRLAVRYGLLPLAELTNEEGNTQTISVIDYIRSEFDTDEITLANDDLARTLNAVVELSAQWAGSEYARVKAEAEAKRSEIIERGMSELRSMSLPIHEMEKRSNDITARADREAAQTIHDAAIRFPIHILGGSPDDDVRALTATMASEKYVLSRIFTKEQHVATEDELLDVKVPRAVYGLKIAILQWREKELRVSIAQNPTSPEAVAALPALRDLRALISQLAKFLGERIVLPR